LIHFPFHSKSHPFFLKITLSIIGLTIIIMLSGMIFSSCDDSPSIHGENIIKFKDATVESGLERFSESFGAVFTDIDNDGDDDLIVSNHGLFIPSIYLNKSGSFEDLSRLFRLRRPRDWHGATVVDMDNDGDRDIAIAGGGGGGIKKGAPNLLFRNMLKETGDLAFTKIAKEVEVIKQKWRGLIFPEYQQFR